MNILRVRQEEEQNIGVSMSIWLVRERVTFIQAKGPRGTQSLQERHDTNTHDFWQAPVTPHPRELWPHHFPSQKAGARKSMWSGGCRVTSWALGTRCRSPLPSPFVSGVLPPPSRPGHNHIRPPGKVGVRIWAQAGEAPAWHLANSRLEAHSIITAVTETRSRCVAYNFLKGVFADLAFS